MHFLWHSFIFNRLIFLLVFLEYTSISAQNISFWDRIYLEGNSHYGFVVPHHRYIAYFIEDHVKSNQINIGIHTTGNKNWHKYYNYPDVGIGFYYSGLGNDHVYGKMTAVYAYAERYFFNRAGTFNISNRMAYGFSYLNKKYDINSNNFDVVIGSHLNVFLSYSVLTTLRINQQFIFKLGLGLTHTSNGNFRLPNRGLNLVTTFAGLQYSLRPYVVHKTEKLASEGEFERNQYIVTFGTGTKQIDIPQADQAMPLALSLEYGRRVTQTGWLGASANFYYDPSVRKKIEWSEDTASTWDNLRITLNFSYELRFGKLGYIIQPGIYLKNSYSVVGVISNRLGLRYHFNKRFVAGATIKAHWFAIADFVEFGIGYKWN